MTERRAGWADAYEAGYQVGYRHGLADAKEAREKPAREVDRDVEEVLIERRPPEVLPFRRSAR